MRGQYSPDSQQVGIQGEDLRALFWAQGMGSNAGMFFPVIFLLTLFEGSRLLSCGFFPPFFSPPRLQRAMCCIWRAGRGNNGNAYCFLHWAFSVEKFQSGPCFQALLCRGQAKSGKCILEIYASIMPHFRDQSELGSLWILRSSRT